MSVAFLEALCVPCAEWPTQSTVLCCLSEGSCAALPASSAVPAPAISASLASPALPGSRFSTGAGVAA